MGITTNKLCFPLSSPGKTVLKNTIHRAFRSSKGVKHQLTIVMVNSIIHPIVFPFFLLHSSPRLLLSKNHSPKQTISMQALTLCLTFKSTQCKTYGIRRYFSNSGDVNNWFINHISKVTPFQANPELASKSLGFLKIFPTKELTQPKNSRLPHFQYKPLTVFCMQESTCDPFYALTSASEEGVAESSCQHHRTIFSKRSLIILSEVKLKQKVMEVKCKCSVS